MKTIVLITRENGGKTTHVSVYLCGDRNEANLFCHFVNGLSLAGGDKLVARKVIANGEYSLEKYVPFQFEDLVKIDDRTTQKIMRETDSSILAIALKNAEKELKDHFLRNMSKRAACMLEEDMEYINPDTESEEDNARNIILNIYDDLFVEDIFNQAFVKYDNLKESNSSNTDRNHIILVFRGAGALCESVSIYLFEEDNSAENFCNYLNSLKQESSNFIYARHAEQMVEYETVKPLLVRFDQIFENSDLYHEQYGDSCRSVIIREALKNFQIDTILQALKGLDKRSRTLLMQTLPVKTTDAINESIEHSDDMNINYFSNPKETRRAQQKIINAINKTAEKFRRKKVFGEIIKD
jgi:hypothetical protein